MKVFKFGGASVRDAGGIRNLAQILSGYEQHHLVVVVSAMGKTTNALERVVTEARAGRTIDHLLAEIDRYHRQEMEKLFAPGHPVFDRLTEYLLIARQQASLVHEEDRIYDQVVSLGELISTSLVAAYLEQEGFRITWKDARQAIATDNTFREGRVNWEATRENLNAWQNQLSQGIIVTQGFIGSTPDGFTTTLGREGSDYTAAIIASCLKAESVTIWKDVPGVMNADPKKLPAAVVFEELPFREAAEMTYYGASVIHPKTIKPLAQHGIPLYVKSFLNPDLPGTRIHECKVHRLPPLIVLKENQCLVSCKVTDYSFVTEEQVGHIFQVVSRHGIKINLMQNSAITFSFCVDFRESRILPLIEELGNSFEVYYNTGLTLVTVKNYDTRTLEEYRHKPGIIMEQASRSTVQLLIKDS
ncbi:MAG: aspartate kinase [Cyclobacteriaceae bacterium]|jgi:aspartate kinase